MKSKKSSSRACILYTIGGIVSILLFMYSFYFNQYQTASIWGALSTSLFYSAVASSTSDYARKFARILSIVFGIFALMILIYVILHSKGMI
jgi:succinate dehydrogenase hydrophobic anchor subunit